MHFPNGSALLSQSGTTLLRNNTPSLTLPAFETQELGWENYLVRVVAAIGLTFLARWMYQSARSRWGPVNHINAHGWWFFTMRTTCFRYQILEFRMLYHMVQGVSYRIHDSMTR